MYRDTTVNALPSRTIYRASERVVGENKNELAQRFVALLDLAAYEAEEKGQKVNLHEVSARVVYDPSYLEEFLQVDVVAEGGH